MNLIPAILLALLAAPEVEKPVRVADVISGHNHPSLAVTKKGYLLAIYNKQGGGGKELL